MTAREAAVTSRIMSSVRSKDSKAEMALRRHLHASGFRYRLHARDVYGCPDLVVRSQKLAIFVDGDFWHGNPDEPTRRGRASFADLFPNRTEYWLTRITRNVDRDKVVNAALTAEEWTVIRIWESCVLADAASAAARLLTVVASSRGEGGQLIRL